MTPGQHLAAIDQGWKEAERPLPVSVERRRTHGIDQRALLEAAQACVQRGAATGEVAEQSLPEHAPDDGRPWAEDGSLRHLGKHRLKGIDELTSIWQMEDPALPDVEDVKF